MMALISWAAKKRPGHACRPYPKLSYFSLEQSSSCPGRGLAYLREAGLDATYCARPSISGRSSLILENRNGSNTPGLGYRDSSIVMACVGMPIVVCAGIVKPEDNVSGL